MWARSRPSEGPRVRLSVQVEGIMDGDGMKKLSDASPAPTLHPVRGV